MNKLILVFALLLCSSATLAGAEKFSKGPLIKNFGAVADINSVDFPVDTQRMHRVVFDLSTSPDDPEAVNRGIETLARYLNMHARAGVPAGNMQLALVVHGAAGKDVLNNAAYQQRLQVDNPNLPLLNALATAGVKTYICGQTAAYRGYAKKELAAVTDLALSALTVLEELQHQGYSLIAF
jgi:intracellular sulfur oxidation DsrE/DsrF family protein